jgi:hypothetical protein
MIARAFASAAIVAVDAKSLRACDRDPEGNSQEKPSKARDAVETVKRGSCAKC